MAYASTKGHSLLFKNHTYFGIEGRGEPKMREHHGPAIIDNKRHHPSRKHSTRLVKVGERKVLFIAEKKWRGLDGSVLHTVPAQYRTIPVLTKELLIPNNR